MAIQFYDGGILFVDGEIAMDPACCCGPGELTQCCESPWPDNWGLIVSGITNGYRDNCIVLNDSVICTYAFSGSGWTTYQYTTTSGDYTFTWGVFIKCDLANRKIDVKAQVTLEIGSFSWNVYWTGSITITDDGTTNCSDLLGTDIVLSNATYWGTSPTWCESYPDTVTIHGYYD